MNSVHKGLMQEWQRLVFISLGVDHLGFERGGGWAIMKKILAQEE